MKCDKCGYYNGEPHARTELIEEIIKAAQKQLMFAKVEAFINNNARETGNKIIKIQNILQDLSDHVFTLKLILENR